MSLKKFVPKVLKKLILKEIDKSYLFSGWNLKTKTCPPWKYVNKNLDISSQSINFESLQTNFEELIKEKKFVSNQFNKNMILKSRELMWRHFNLCLSLNYVLQKKKQNLNLCEFGVADGITAWFALKFLEKENIIFNNFWLYDTWDEIQKKNLDKTEKHKIGKFKNNDIEQTRKNLNSFKNLKYIKGFIPEIFSVNESFPQKCDWMHIDLNSSYATIQTLNFFKDKLTSNGIIIFDDFGWPSYETTRIEIEKWSNKNDGILWPLPTGQAIFFLNK